MNRTTALRAAAYAAVAVPFAFGVLRYATTGNDLRYVWMVIATFAAAEMVIRVGGRSGALQRPALLAAVVLVVATAVAFGAGYVVGARNTVSMLIVSLSFGGCFAVGALLRRMAAAPA